MGMVSGTRSQGVRPSGFSATGKEVLSCAFRPLTYLLHRGPAAKATQGVPKSVHKLFCTRGEAIVAYQIVLLRGEVLLMNEKEPVDEGEVDSEGETDKEVEA